MEILIVAILISSISIYGTITLKRFYFTPLVKPFVLRTLFSLSVINLIAIFLVKYDSNMPEGITERMRIIPMIMHAVLGILPIVVLFRLSKKKTDS